MCGVGTAASTAPKVNVLPDRNETNRHYITETCSAEQPVVNISDMQSSVDRSTFGVGGRACRQPHEITLDRPLLLSVALSPLSSGL